MSTDKVVIGIDLGTTNTCVAIAKKKGKTMEYEVVENLQGARTTPSVVSFTADGEQVVGAFAKTQQLLNPERTVYGVKRLFGHKRGDEDVETLFRTSPFKVDFDDEDDPIIIIPAQGSDKERKYKPEQISAMVLSEVVSIVKNKTGKAPDECIITVPAYFNDLQRNSTLLAAKIAGINCIKLVNEPTAAAIAYQEKTKFNNGNVLVFDFGGGTLDVSILQVEGNKFIVKAVAGDTSLGGEDIDQILCEEMINRFKKANPGLDPTENKRSLAHLKQACEKAKCQLSTALEAQVTIGSFYKGKDLNEKITRARIEFLCDERIIGKLTDPIEEALEEAGLDADEIDQIILVGGSSHIPAVNEAVTSYFDERIKPLSTVNVDEAVALGACIICDKIGRGKVFDDKTQKDLKLVDVNKKSGSGGGADGGDDIDDGYIVMVDVQPTSIGIRNGTKEFQKFIMRNKELPQSNRFTFKTTKKNQKFANIDIFQGEDDIIDTTTRTHSNLGRFKLTGLPKGEAGQILITVTMSVDTNGVLKVTAECSGSSEGVKSLQINVKEALSSEEMQAAIKEQNEMFERKELKAQYEKLNVDLYKEISRIRGKGKDTKQWEAVYKNFSENVPKEPETLRDSIDKLNKTIEKIKAI